MKEVIAGTKRLEDYFADLVVGGLSWPKGENGVTVIPYTFNPNAALKRLEKGDAFRKGGSSFSITKQNNSKIQVPPDYLQRFAEWALKQWQEASEGKIIFERVDDLKDGKGIVIASCGTYTELRGSAFTPRRDNGGIIEFSLACFPSDYRSDVLASGGEGAHTYVKNTALHELGHALGLEHPHEYPLYAKHAIQTGDSGCKMSIMAYPDKVCEEVISCNEKNRNDLKCYETYPVAPGSLDKLALQKKYSQTFQQQVLNEVEKAVKPIASGFAQGFAVEAIEQTTNFSKTQAQFAYEGAIAATIALASPPTALTYMAVTNLPRTLSFINQEVLGNKSGFVESLFDKASSIAGFAAVVSGDGVLQTTARTITALGAQKLGKQSAKYLAEKANKVLEV